MDFFAINHVPQSSEPRLQPISEQSIGIRRDAFFYFDNVAFLVEDVLFKLPRYYFEQNSKALRPIFFSTPSENVKRFAGDQIIHLDGISEKDFRLMLKVAFPESLWGRLGPESGDAKERPVDILGASELRCWKDWASVLKVSTQLQLDSIRDVSVRRLTSSPTSVEDWVGVLRMATEWEVWEVRETAIRRLGSARAAISLLDKIDLALECKVEEWLLKGYQQLVERNEVISSEEEGRLGWKTTSRLFRLRHKYIRERRGPRSGLYSPPGPNLIDNISNAFSTELKALTYTGNPNGRRLTMKKASLINKETLSGGKKSLHYSSVIFLVQKTLFKIPWHYLKQNSDVFRNIPSLPLPNNQVIDGSRDENPFRLDGISKDDFIHLLRAIFRADSVAHPDQTLSWKDWISVHKLSDMWLIDSLRKEAVTHITHPPKTPDEWSTILRWSTEKRIPDARATAIQYLSSSKLREIQKVQLARECNIADWLVDSYSELVRRDAEIEEDEENLLGRETTSKLFRIRDKYLQARYTIMGIGSTYDIDSAIHAAFKAELEVAKFIP